MCETLGYEVRDLVRVRIMNIRLGSLGEGQYRKLSDAELNQLYDGLTDSPSESRPGQNDGKTGG